MLLPCGSESPSVLDRRNRLIEAHLDLVAPLARAILVTLPPVFDLDDLIGAGNLGLVEAAARYRPAEHGDAPFAAYARLVIRGFILSSVRRVSYREAMRPGIESAPEPAAASDTEGAIDRDRLALRVAREVEALPRRLAAVITLHYAAEVRLREVGCRFGCGKGRASRLHMVALEALRARLAPV